MICGVWVGAKNLQKQEVKKMFKEELFEEDQVAEEIIAKEELNEWEQQIHKEEKK